jgi:hypothetical protein
MKTFIEEHNNLLFSQMTKSKCTKKISTGIIFHTVTFDLQLINTEAYCIM